MTSIKLFSLLIVVFLINSCAKNCSLNNKVIVVYNSIDKTFNICEGGKLEKLDEDQLKMKLEEKVKKGIDLNFDLVAKYKISEETALKIFRIFKKLLLKPRHFWVPVSDLVENGEGKGTMFDILKRVEEVDLFYDVY